MTIYNIQHTKYESGFGQIILIVALALGIVALSATSYYLLKAQGKAPVGQSTLYPTATVTPTETPVTKTETEIGVISNLNDTKTIEREINSTDLDSIDSELNILLGVANSI